MFYWEVIGKLLGSCGEVMKVKITKKIIEKTKTGERVQDSEFPALFLVAGPQKKSWAFMKKWKYKKFYKVLGDASNMARENAAQKCKLLESNLIQFGALDPSYQAGDQKKVTLQNIMDLYGEKHPEYVKKILPHLAPLLPRKIDDITREMFSELHRNISRQHSTTANRVIQYTRAAINEAITSGMIQERNPAARIPLNREEPRQRYLLPSEVPAVIAELQKMQLETAHRASAEALLLMLYTWQRKGNVLAMEWREIDETGIWTIPAQKAKARKDITVALIPEALAIIQARKERVPAGRYVFPGTKEDTHLLDCKRTWKTVCTRCEIENCHIHDLRHTGATYALKAGADITTISSALAHASVSFTAKVYAHVMTESKLQAAQGAFAEMTKKKE